MRRIVLAYSGDLECSVAIPWLTERYGAEVVTLTLDLGQGGELTDIRERALAAGAVRAHVIDAREEMVRDFVVPALQAGAFHASSDPLAVELGRALIARRLVDVAQMESAFAVAHGSDGASDSDGAAVSAFDTMVRTLNPALTVLAPVRLWEMSPPEVVDYARRRNISMSAEDAPAAVNLWGRSIRSGSFDAPTDLSGTAFTMTRPTEDCPDEAAHIHIDFEQGVPVRANAIDMSLLELIDSLAIIGGAHGVGRLESVTSTGSGQGRIVHEAPAACLLDTAYAALEKIALPSDVHQTKRQSSDAYADLVRQGRWFSPERETSDAYIRTLQPRVTGRVALKLFKGTHQVTAADTRLHRAEQEVTS